MPWNFSAEPRGRPLREIIHAEISIQFDCGSCGHCAVWPWHTMMREEKFQPLMRKMIHEFAPSASKLYGGAGRGVALRWIRVALVSALHLT